MHLTDFHSLELYFPPYASFLFWAFLGLTEIAIKTISLAYAISQLFESSTTIIHDLGGYERIYLDMSHIPFHHSKLLENIA